MQEPSKNTVILVSVWDGLVRLFHWSMVLLVTVAAISGFLIGGQAIDFHVWSGALIGALVLVRLIWGFVGGSFARFAGFIVGPNAVLQHLRELRAGHAPRHLGHNPLGGVMILALLGALLALVATGVMLLGGVFRTGPLLSMISYGMGRTVGAVHQALAIGLLALVAAHVAGALYESRRTRENLVLSMINGRKRALPAVLSPRFVARPALAAGLVAASIGVGALIILPLSNLPFHGAPVQTTGSQYASACGECHAPYHPSLLPAASWKALMTSLGDHFGEDASLGAADQGAITAFLVANAAESTETKPGHVFRQVDPAKPFEITASPFWQRVHAPIDESVFAMPAVGSKANCSACHEDAVTGWFYPGTIEIPDVAEGSSP